MRQDNPSGWRRMRIDRTLTLSLSRQRERGRADNASQLSGRRALSNSSAPRLQPLAHCTAPAAAPFSPRGEGASAPAEADEGPSAMRMTPFRCPA